MLIKYQRFIKFGLVGGLNTVLSQLIYMVCVHFDLLSVSLASVAGDSITMIISYLLNMKFTYHEKITLKSAVSYPIAYIPGIVFASLFTMAANYFGIPKLWSKAITLPVTIPLNYFLVSLMVKITARKKS